MSLNDILALLEPTGLIVDYDYNVYSRMYLYLDLYTPFNFILFIVQLHCIQ